MLFNRNNRVSTKKPEDRGRKRRGKAKNGQREVHTSEAGKVAKMEKKRREGARWEAVEAKGKSNGR